MTMQIFTYRCYSAFAVAATVTALCRTEAGIARNFAAEASAWLRVHSTSGAPNEDELAELKGANPEAYAIVKALLTKKAMGLIKTPDHQSRPIFPLPLQQQAIKPPDDPQVSGGLRPPSESLGSTSLGDHPSAELVNSGAPPPVEPPPIVPSRPTGPPAMPPPPPIPGPPPPEIDDLPLPAALMSPAEVKASLKVTVPDGFEKSLVPEGFKESLVRAPQLLKETASESIEVRAKTPLLSAASLSMSNTAGSQHDWLNWRPDQMIAENEKMVQSVLGAVAQLTGGHAPSRAAVDEHVGPRSESSLAPNQAVQPTASAFATAPDAAAEIAPERPTLAEPVRSSGIGSSVSWGNPFTFTASSNAELAPEHQENQFLKGIDLGVPQITLPPSRSSDAENPYLNGLNLEGTPAPQLSIADVSAKTLTAVHKAQLLDSHKLLSAYDSNDVSAEQGQAAETRRTISRRESQHSVNLNNGGASDAARHEDDSNPYMAIFGLAPSSPKPAQTANLRGHESYQNNRFPLASFKWDDAASGSSAHSQPSRQLSMASSKVHQKNLAQKKNSQVAQNAQQKNPLNGWLKVASAPKIPDARAQKLRQSIQQAVADDNNPYLKGLELDSGVPQLQVGPNTPGNSYMNRLD